MKHFAFLVLVACIIALAGCRTEAQLGETQDTETFALDATWQDATDPPQTKPTTGYTTPTTEGRGDETTEPMPTSPQTTAPTTESIAKNDNEEPTTTATEPPATTAPPTEAATQPTEATQPVTQPTEVTESPVTEPSQPEEVKAQASDAGAIAEKLVEYLNAYRLEQGSPTVTVLPGLTRYAEYRSRQLISNFAHDTFDERAAATALEYGTYIDPSLFGLTDDPYYTANAREAIAKTDYGGTIDQVAAYLARMTRNSASHWSYVGGSGYTYIGIGITYEKGVWYCDIAVTGENTDNQ